MIVLIKINLLGKKLDKSKKMISREAVWKEIFTYGFEAGVVERSIHLL